jgi:hypothetical protein
MPRFWMRGPRFFSLLASTTTVTSPNMRCAPMLRLNSKITAERKWETEAHRSRDERFE